MLLKLQPENNLFSKEKVRCCKMQLHLAAKCNRKLLQLVKVFCCKTKVQVAAKQERILQQHAVPPKKENYIFKNKSILSY
jgi:hypothetical protein